MWEYILRVGLKPYTKSNSDINFAIKQLRRNDNLHIVIEPIAVNAVYGTETWGDEANTFELDDSHCDDDFAPYIHPSNYKPALKEYNSGESTIIRVASTASYMSQYIYEMTGCVTGGANSKWTNEALPFCMTLQESDLGREAIPQTTKPTKLDYVTINDKHLSYGMGLLSKTIKDDFINTYDGTSDKPAPSEKPVKTDDKDTTGNNNITKIYFDVEVDTLTNKIEYKYINAFTTKKTIGNINIIPEEDKTGYKISKWGVAENGEDLSSFYNDRGYNSIIRQLSAFKQKGDKDDVPKKLFLDDVEKVDKDKENHLYILYTKTTTIPAPDIQSYDFEIPESYITKQIYFQQGLNTSNTNNTAQKLINQQFEWTSAAHTQCPGHKVIDCGKDEHAHKPWVDMYNRGCYTEVEYTVYECNNNKETKCGKEHIHSDENCKELTGYKCSKCGATGITKDKVKKSTNHKSSNGCSNSTIKPVYGNYKVPAYKCVQCSKLYSTRPNGCLFFTYF